MTFFTLENHKTKTIQHITSNLNATGCSFNEWGSVSFLKWEWEKRGKKGNHLPTGPGWYLAVFILETPIRSVYPPGSCPVLMFCLSYSSRLPWAEKPAAPAVLSMGVKNSIIARPSAAPLLRVSAFCPARGGWVCRTETAAASNELSTFLFSSASTHRRPRWSLTKGKPNLSTFTRLVVWITPGRA